MIPYPYNMVDMGGIDIAEANDTVVEGLYAKIVEAVNACGDVVLYNWKFAGIEIAPQHTQILLGVGALTINTLIQVTEQDVVTVLGIAPPVVPVEPLNVSENGVYTATPPASGFNPVNVEVPAKVLVPLSVIENGEYDPSDYDADGFNAVTVEVPAPQAGKYQEVEPDFFGLTCSYLTLDGIFRVANVRNQCYFLATTEANAKYVVFLPESVSSRFRVGLWGDKSYSDFAPYLDATYTPYVDVYTGASVITGSTELFGDGLTRRFFFTGNGGEVLIGTSNESVLIKPILLKIQEE